MEKFSKIYVAGHKGLVGSALIRVLTSNGYENIITRSHQDLDLTDQVATLSFFQKERPEFVFLAAAKVGGILANNTYPADFIRDNIYIQTNIIQSAHRTGVKRLLFLGSSCIYPKQAPQPLKEQYLLTGSLEPTNRPYALAKIAGIELCWSYNRQYGTQYLAVMPTNLYGPEDNFDLSGSHVLPALIRKFHDAKKRGDRSVIVWGTGSPRREFLYSDDMAGACIFLMNLPENEFQSLLGGSQAEDTSFAPPIINIGCGEDITIRELACLVKNIVGFNGEIEFDRTKPDGTPRKLLDISKMNNLKWFPEISLEDGISQVYATYSKNYDSSLFTYGEFLPE